MKQILLIVFSIVCLVPIPTPAQKGASSVGAIFRSIIGDSANRKPGQNDVESALHKLGNELNKNTPRQIDENTRWDTTMAGPGRKLTYHYTFLGGKSNQIDKAIFREYMTGRLKGSVCSSPDTDVFFQNDVTVLFRYEAADQVFIATLEFTPSSCGYPRKK